jgi:hypothetical protein
MAELKTKRNKGDVEAFLKSVPDERKNGGTVSPSWN